MRHLLALKLLTIKETKCLVRRVFQLGLGADWSKVRDVALEEPIRYVASRLQYETVVATLPT